MKRLDIVIGGIYGRWTVVCRSECQSHGLHYLCRCKCGTLRSVVASALFNGKSKSCGCIQKETNANIITQLQVRVPKRVGRWNVKELVRVNGRCSYRCVCDCGVEKTIRMHHLLDNSSLSCGCLRQETYIEKVSQSHFICKKCGLEKPKSRFQQNKSNEGKVYIVTCKCLDCITSESVSRYASDLEYRVKHLWRSSRDRALRKSLPHTIDTAWIKSQLDLQNGKCFYTGIVLTMETGDRSISIDRKDSSLGYIPENVVLCCSRINSMKSDCSVTEFLQFCKAVTSHQA